MIEESTLKPLSIDAETDPDATLKACWGFGNQLYLSHGCKPHRDGCGKPEAGSNSVNENDRTIFQVKWNLDMQNEKMRELVCQSRYIFMQVQQLFGNEPATQSTLLNKQLTDKLVGFSQQYRAVIRTCTNNLRECLQDTSLSTEERQEGDGCLEVFDMCELVWSLAEVLYLNTHQHGTGMVTELLEWYKVRFHDDHLHEQVLKHSQPHQHPLYWNLMTTLVLQGSMEEACHLLDTHPDQSKPFQTMHFLINNMPLYTSSGSEWAEKRRQWKEVCKEHVHDAVFADHHELHQLCRILSGEEAAFTEHLHLLPSWYCLLISQLFFQDPSIPPSDLRIHAPGCIERYGVQDSMTTWDEILLSIVQMDVKQAIATYCKHFSNWWFSSHLTDLLHHAGCIPPKTLNYGSDLREFLLLDYATSLLSCPSLNEVALDYFSMCPVYGRWHMEEMIDRMGVVSDRQAEKVVSIYARYALTKQATEVKRRQGVRAMKVGRFSTALKWCVSAKDVDLSFVLVQTILQKLSLPELHHLDILSHFPHSLTFSDHLVFLGKLVEYERKVVEGRAEEAVGVMMSLFNEKSTTKSYWLMMFEHLLKALQEHKVDLNRDDSMKLLECIDEYTIDNNSITTANTTDQSNIHESTTEKSTYESTLLPFRLLLAQSLALSLL